MTIGPGAATGLDVGAEAPRRARSRARRSMQQDRVQKAAASRWPVAAQHRAASTAATRCGNTVLPTAGSAGANGHRPKALRRWQTLAAPLLGGKTVNAPRRLWARRGQMPATAA